MPNEFAFVFTDVKVNADDYIDERDGFNECMRVLDDYGTLIFKWSEVQIPLRDVLKAIGQDPLFGHRSGKHNNTHWMAFMKSPEGKAGDDANRNY